MSTEISSRNPILRACLYHAVSLLGMLAVVLSIAGIYGHIHVSGFTPEIILAVALGSVISVMIVMAFLYRRFKWLVKRMICEGRGISGLEDCFQDGETLYRTFVNTSPDDIAYMNPEGRLLMVNRKGVLLHGYESFEELQSAVPNGFDLVHPEDRLQARDQVAVLMETGLPQRVELRLLRKDGSFFPAEVSSSLIFDTDGHPGGILCIARDISRRVQVEERLNEQLVFVQTLIDAMPNPVFFKNGKGIYLGCNRAFEKYINLPREEIIGKDVFGVAPKDLADVYYQKDRELFENPGSQIYEASVKSSDGTDHDVIFSKATFTNGKGELAGLVGIILDITERKRVEEELRRYRDHLEDLVLKRTRELEDINQRLLTEIQERERAEVELRKSELKNRTILESSLDAIFLETLDGNILDCNSTACQMFGYSREELLSLTVFDLLPENPDFSLEKLIEEEMRNGGMYLEAFNRRKNGDVFPCEVNTMLVILEGERHAVVFLRDITERKRKEEEIRHLNDELAHNVRQLEAANSELEAFNYSVSHDLRTPLISIGGFSRVLLKRYTDSLDEDGHRFLSVIRDNTEKMENLINNLLALSRLGFKQLKISEIDMSGLVTSVYEGLLTGFQGRAVNLKMLPMPPARGDAFFISQVLVNLLSNALKFTRYTEGAMIEAGGWEEQDENVYYIRDNGAGFDMNKVDRIFNAFQRLHGDEYEGSGVGLSIVQRIVNRHGGRAWCEAEPDRGATFYFTLPRKK